MSSSKTYRGDGSRRDYEDTEEETPIFGGRPSSLPAYLGNSNAAIAAYVARVRAQRAQQAAAAEQAASGDAAAAQTTPDAPAVQRRALSDDLPLSPEAPATLAYVQSSAVQRSADGSSVAADEQQAPSSSTPDASEHGPSAAPANEQPASQPAATDAVHSVAAHGISGPGQELPHRERIQAAFGPHALSSVRAHIGGAAAEAAQALGAEAYTTGSDIAFRAPPDLHTAAHEAAHVIQQRGGVQLKGGVGECGDRYEHEADQVADRVVAGQSAAPILDRYSSPGNAMPVAATTSIQRKDRRNAERTDAVATPAMDEDDAIATMQAAADILHHKQRRLVNEAPPSARKALELLYLAAVGASGETERADPAKRLEWLNLGLRQLEPAMRVVYGGDTAWFRSEFAVHVERLRHDLQFEIASDRADQALLLPGQRKVIEIPKEGLSDQNAEAYGHALMPGIEKLISTYAMLNDRIISLGHHNFEKAFEEMKKGWDTGMLRMERSRLTDPGAIVNIQSALVMLKGLLSAPDAWRHAKHAESRFGKIESYTHLVQVAVETVGGLATLAAAMGATVAKLSGQLQVATRMMGLAGVATLNLGTVIAAIEVVHGILVAFDSHASADSKLQGIAEAAIGFTWLAGYGLEKGFLKIAGASTVGAAASGLMAAGYLLWAATMTLHGKALIPLVTGGLRPKFEYMAESAVRIQVAADRLIKAGLLLEQETYPPQREALSRVLGVATRQLDQAVDYFLDDCVRGKSVGVDDSTRRSPGEDPHLRTAFAPLLSLRGESPQPEVALRKADQVLSKITEVLQDAPNYVRLSMGLDRVSASASETD